MVEKRSKTAVIAALICGAGILFGGPVVFYGVIPLFLKPVSADLGWGRATFTLMSVGGAAGVALTAPFVGMAADRWGVKRVVLIGSAIFGLAITALSQLTPFVPLLIAIGFIQGCASAAKGPVPYTKVISTWFFGNRGFVLGLVLGVSLSLGLTIVPYLIQFLLAHFSWRVSFIIFGLGVWIVNLSTSFFLPRDPVRRREDSTAASVQLEGMTGRQALRTATFWMLAGAVVVSTSCTQALRVHMAAYFDDRGMTRQIIVAALSVGPFVGVAGQFLSGVLLDRVQSRLVVAPFFFAAAIGVVLIVHGTATPVIMLGVVILGFANAVEAAVLPYFLSRYFGLRSISEIYGYCMALLGLISSLAPYLLGLCFDKLHSYGLGLTTIEVLLTCCAISMTLLPVYTYAIQRHPT